MKFRIGSRDLLLVLLIILSAVLSITSTTLLHKQTIQNNGKNIISSESNCICSVNTNSMHPLQLQRQSIHRPQRQNVDVEAVYDDMDNQSIHPIIKIPSNQQFHIVAVTTCFTLNEKHKIALRSWFKAFDGFRNKSWKELVKIVIVSEKKYDSFDLGTDDFTNDEVKDNIEVYNITEQMTVMGQPTLNAILQVSYDKAIQYSAQWILNVNCDVILQNTLQKAIDHIPIGHVGVGMRLDCDVDEENIREVYRLNKRVEEKASNCTMHGATGKDYFLYNPGEYGHKPFVQVPKLIATYAFKFDDWMVSSKFPNTVDLTPMHLAVHINHEPKRTTTAAGRRNTTEALYNKELWDHLKKNTNLPDTPQTNSVWGARYQLCPLHNTVDDNVYYLNPLPRKKPYGKLSEMYSATRFRWVSPWKLGIRNHAKEFGCQYRHRD